MGRLSNIGRVVAGLLLVAAIAGLVLWRIHPGGPPKPGLPPAKPAAEACDGAAPAGAAAANAASLTTLAWAPFGRSETGWATYAPLIAREIGTRCAPGSRGFAADLGAWQATHRLAADGVFKPQDFEIMRVAMMLRRPFVQETSKGNCPAAPADTALASAAPGEAYGNKPIQLREGALDAYRRMVQAAKAAGVARGEVLKLVSGYRGPAEEAARCADGGCNTVTRAHCSAHRTGLAMDLYLDHLPGRDPTSTDDANRRAMAESAAYRWLVAHAGDYGFLPYPYEPWHWEWTGEPP